MFRKYKFEVTMITLWIVGLSFFSLAALSYLHHPKEKSDRAGFVIPLGKKIESSRIISIHDLKIDGVPTKITKVCIGKDLCILSSFWNGKNGGGLSFERDAKECQQKSGGKK